MEPGGLKKSHWFLICVGCTQQQDHPAIIPDSVYIHLGVLLADSHSVSFPLAPLRIHIITCLPLTEIFTGWLLATYSLPKNLHCLVLLLLNMQVPRNVFFPKESYYFSCPRRIQIQVQVSMYRVRGAGGGHLRPTKSGLLF